MTPGLLVWEFSYDVPPKQKPALGSPAPPGVLAVVVFCFGCTWLISPILNLAKKSILISLPLPLRHCLMECLVWDWPFSRQLGDGKQQPHSGQMRFHIVWLIWSLSQLPNSFPSSSAIQKRCHLRVLTLLLNLGRRLETHTAVWFREGNAPGSLSAAAGNLNPTSACCRAVGVVRVLRRPWLSLNCERHLCGYPETSLVWNNLWGSDSTLHAFQRLRSQGRTMYLDIRGQCIRKDSNSLICLENRSKWGFHGNGMMEKVTLLEMG